MALTANLVSYWTLNEASGTRADSVGMNTLTDNHGVGGAAGVINNAGSFVRASAQFLSHVDNTDLSTGDIDWTVSLWVNLTTTGIQQQFAGKGDGTNGEWWLRVNFDNQPELRVFGASGFGNAGFVKWGSPLSAGTWYHLVAWHDSVNNQLGIVVNAGTAVTASHSLGVFDGTAAFYIGWAGFGAGNTTNGLIDEVGFWKRVLTSAERASLYNGGAGFAYPFSGRGGLIPQYYYRSLVGGIGGPF